MGNGNGVTLPHMSADPASITISGHSGGCYMAERMMIIHSSTIKGAGLFSCWPYGVDYDSLLSVTPDTKEELSAHSIADIDTAAAAEQIDPTSNLANNSIYIYSG